MFSGCKVDYRFTSSGSYWSNGNNILNIESGSGNGGRSWSQILDSNNNVTVFDTDYTPVQKRR